MGFMRFVAIDKEGSFKEASRRVQDTSEPGLDFGGDRSAGADFARTGGSPRCGVLGRGGGCRANAGGEPRKSEASGATCQSPGGAAVGNGALIRGAAAGG